MTSQARPDPRDFEVPTLGAPSFASPLPLTSRAGEGSAQFVREGAKVALDVEWTTEREPPLLVEKAGPRARLFFEPRRVRAAIVTCGGLCPGINDVVRSIVLELHHRYGAASVFGYRYGYEGLDPACGATPIELGVADVRSIHKHGGSVLGLSRGRHDVEVLIDTLVAHEIDMLFAIGGDGTLRGASAIERAIRARGLPIAVVGVPKTIDNDVPYVDKTFGFDTAVEHARVAIDAAHGEATGARNGVGLVKLMGRDAGFIAAAATLASHDVNVCLIPEVPFTIGGDHGLLAALERRLRARSHAVVVIAEGCAASLSVGRAERDASGNTRYASGSADVGASLRDAITAHFEARGVPLALKYIDPSYMIRSVPASTSDAILCGSLGRHAVHAAMAGKTGILIGRVHGVFTHVPLAVATRTRKRIDPEGDEWLAVLESTGQSPLGPAVARAS
jgi:6-phosphofructokinase 1